MSSELKIFNELESFNVQEQENAKQKFAEAFASSEYQGRNWTQNFLMIFLSLKFCYFRY